MLKWLTLWLMRPVIEEIELSLNHRIGNLCTHVATDNSGKAAIVVANLERVQAQLTDASRADIIRGTLETGKGLNLVGERIDRLAETVGRRICDLESNVKREPALNTATLRIWEAVTYSCAKWERDGEAHRELNPQSEILAWARIYLHENEWADPGDDVLKMFIDMRRKFDTGVRVKVNG